MTRFDRSANSFGRSRLRHVSIWLLAWTTIVTVARSPTWALCTTEELASRNPERCAQKYAMAVRRCVGRSIPLAVCDTSSSARFCSQLSAACAPTVDIDQLAQVTYGAQPADSCRRSLFAAASKLVVKHLMRARTGKADRYEADVAACVRRAPRRCDAAPVLLAPCSGVASPAAAATCLCGLRVDWVITIDSTAPPAGRMTPALLGHYDLSGALFRYDQVPGLVAATQPIGFAEWRVGGGRWESSTQLLPTLSSGSPCFFPVPGAFAPPGTTDLDLIAARDWFTDNGQPVTLPMTLDDTRYALAYLRSVIDVAAAFGAQAYVSIDHMPRALSASRQPLRNDCSWSFMNRVSNVRPVDPAVFAAATAGMVRRIVEGSGGEPGRPVTHWEIWNEPELPYFWDPSFETGLDRYVEMAVHTLVALDAYRQGSTHPAAASLRFGLGSFAVASTAGNLLTALDANPIPGYGAVPIDFISFHSYDNDPLKIVDDVKLVATAAAASQHYAGAEIVLAEWGPSLDTFSDAAYSAGIEPSLLASTVIALGAAAGLDRAHHALFWDFYDNLAAGLLDHQLNARPLYYTYTLLHALIGSGADRFAPLGFEDGRLDGGAAATLAGRDGTGVLRVLFVNRSDVLRTARVDVNGASKAPANVLVLDDPAQPPHGTQPAPPTIVVPARSIVLAELGAG